MLLYEFSAYTCNGEFSVTHSSSLSPSTPSPSGSTFSLSCIEGYSPTQGQGQIICNQDNMWSNKPSCQGKGSHSNQLISCIAITCQGMCVSMVTSKHLLHIFWLKLAPEFASNGGPN